MLNEKVVVVTGGAGLIGRSFVRCIAENGGVAVVADVDRAAGEALAEKLCRELSTDRVVFMELDITDKSSLQRLLERLHQRYGRVDALVNNAYPRNRHYGRRLEDVEYADFCENVSLHLGGYFLAAQQCCAYFQRQGRGTVINMASIYGVVAPRFSVYEDTPMTMPVEYAAIKSAIVHLTRYMASYFKGQNIRVNCISPGGILDGQPEDFLERYNAFASSKGMLAAADLNGVLLFLLSDMSSFVNGQNIVVDDGWSL